MKALKWQAKDMDTYLQAKEYVDTAIIPLIPISWQSDIKTTVAMGEFISIISQELEHQFQGRVVLFPAFTYLKNEQAQTRLERLLSWKAELQAGAINHLVFTTADSSWKASEAQLEELLVWLPTVPLENLDLKMKREVVTGQIQQLVPILTNKWQNR